MFTSSVSAALISGLMASGSLESAQWRTSYRDAAAAATQARKPIAVFITAGNPGKLVTGGLGQETAKLLRDGFVPLSVDTATPAGKQLAASFNLTEGLVISDRTGGLQALRHGGGVSDAELKSYLERFAGTAAVATTEYRGAASAVVAQPTPVYQSQYVQPQYVQPRPVLNVLQNAGGYVQSFGGATLGAIRGTCPNCR